MARSALSRNSSEYLQPARWALPDLQPRLGVLERRQHQTPRLVVIGVVLRPRHMPAAQHGVDALRVCVVQWAADHIGGKHTGLVGPENQVPHLVAAENL